MEFEKLVKLARHCAEVDACINCPVGGCQGVTGIMNRLADAVEKLSRAQEQWIEQERKMLLKSLPRWIPVTERLPEFDEEVLVARDFAHRYEVRTAHIAVEVDGHSWWSATNVTHWMPLPTPPKEEKPNFCEDCNWYEPEEMYCFRQGSHSYDNGNCELWEPRTEPPKEETR